MHEDYFIIFYKQTKKEKYKTCLSEYKNYLICICSVYTEKNSLGNLNLKIF